jgi:hypothetical protein
LLLLCAAARVMVCARTEVPGRDGVAYLWMAEQAAAGDPAALFATVFHPLYPALVAVLLFCLPGLDAVAAGQLVAAGAGALAVLPLFWLTRTLFGSSGATWAGIASAAVGKAGYQASPRAGARPRGRRPGKPRPRRGALTIAIAVVRLAPGPRSRR